VAAPCNLPKLKREMHPCTYSEPLYWISSQKHRTARHPSGYPFCARGGVGRLDMTPECNTFEEIEGQIMSLQDEVGESCAGARWDPHEA
jgi:hypothetical protein